MIPSKDNVVVGMLLERPIFHRFQCFAGLSHDMALFFLRKIRYTHTLSTIYPLPSSVPFGIKLLQVAMLGLNLGVCGCRGVINSNPWK